MNYKQNEKLNQVKEWEYPKVCVNLQTDVRQNYAVWRLFIWRKESPQKATMREMMHDYLKNNDIRIKDACRNYDTACTKATVKSDLHINGQLMETHPEYSVCKVIRVCYVVLQI